MKRVIVENVGKHTIKFLRVLRKATGIGLKASIAIRESLPGVLLDGIADENAIHLAQEFEKIGTKVRLEDSESTEQLIKLPAR